ncbi:Uncharacterised protein [Legionella lansingensis]|uniref:Uncharacterized protein n=1 Tax=Legionella lansingensis TaxID=45067 RepID=A0A0W0VQ46_9GAMM|nr:hypothetical protein [Legionella lansingensis]KTD22283.1 hypothetical protein Llan_1224 [Legionella lansingensis]SNV50640.1 Uncharacterised protein [Legionella lansingensis]
MLRKTCKRIAWLKAMIREFLIETTKSQYEILEIYECKKSGFMKAVVKLSSRHIIEKNISDIVIDGDFIECLDKKTIRTLTYMATIERMKPDYAVVVQHLSDEVDDYILEIQSRTKHQIIKKTPSELLKDKSLLSKLSPIDANRIGYLAGVKDTAKEFKIKSERKM